MRLTPAYLIAVASLLRHARHRSRVGRAARLRLHEHLVLAARRPTSCSPSWPRRSATTPTSRCAASSASAPATSRRWPRVDGVYVGPVDDDEVAELAQQIRDGADPLPDKQLIKRPSADPNANTRQWDRPGTDFAQVESEIERPAPGSDPLPAEPSPSARPSGQPDPEENA